MTWGETTYQELAELGPSNCLPILPLGATEAHGPHLPLNTDCIISQAVAKAVARRLKHPKGIVLPTLEYAPAEFARGFAGTISLRKETQVAVVTDLGFSLKAQGFPALVLVNSHFDPEHLSALYAAVEALRPFPVSYCDLTRRHWAARMSAEFQSGACHAGRYESSVVMAYRPDLVREERRKDLAENPASLSTAIRQGLTSFEQAGGPTAYFGAPALASVQEGKDTVELMADLILEALKETLDYET